MTTKIYSIAQLEAVFLNSKRRLWRVKDGVKVIADNIPEAGESEDTDSEAAWNNFLGQMEAHPHGQYVMYVLTKDKAERNALKYNFIWGNDHPQISGHARQEKQTSSHPSFNADIMFRIQDKLDNEREKHRREMEDLRNYYRQEITEERSRREKAETQLSTLQMNIQMRNTINEEIAKIRPKTVKPKPNEQVLNRVLSIAERGAAIAGHHFGFPMGDLGIAGTDDESEAEEEVEDIGIAFLKRHFPNRKPENAIKMMDYLMTTEKGQEFKTMIELMP